MFQSRCRDYKASAWREGLKLQTQRRKFQSRSGILYVQIRAYYPHVIRVS